MNKKTIFIAGHEGMVGSAILKLLAPNNNIITANKKTLDLLDQTKVNNFFKNNKIDEVYLAAAKVGGIYANNTYPAQFIYENITIATNVIHSSYTHNVNKLLFLGSSCIYPKLCNQPIGEKELLNGYLEPTNEPYAIAKIAGIKMCEAYNRQYKTDYRCIMPTNLYGPNDTYDVLNSHVIPSLILKLHQAKTNNLQEIKLWGTGTAKREFLHVNDLAEAAVFVMNLDKKIYDEKVNKNYTHINIGSGIECSIKELAYMIAEVIGYKGEILFDPNQLEGTPRKILNVDLIHSLGWRHTTDLYSGLISTYEDFKTMENK